MSKVYFIKEITPEKIAVLAERAGISMTVRENDFTGIKIHFGEEGNLGYIKPKFVKPIVEIIKSNGAKPFLTDANTIYVGSRANAIEHTEIAIEHGFTIANTGAPVLISDGLRGNSGVYVDINLKHFKKVHISNAVYFCDSLVFMTHFKGHEISGFGGALKNIGMGCATREGKYQQHNSVLPSADVENCSACGACIKWCPANALSLPGEGFITLDKNKCVGCGECILSCPFGVFKIPWNEAVSAVQERIVEYAYGTVRNKRCFYINFLNHITKYCDCYKTKEVPYFDELGVLASEDPVAIDVASVELINSAFKSDFFKHIFPSIDWKVQLEYAQKLGLGETRYELITLD